MKLMPETGANTLKPNDRLERLEKETTNLGMATRIAQMLLKQVMEQLQPMQSDLRNATGMLNDYQYRTLALQELLGVDVKVLKVKADALKLTDWQAASDKDDAEQGFLPVDTVTTGENVVVITSTVEGKDDVGIFRSKTVLAETGNAALVDALMGKTVGDKVEVELNGDRHTITLLAVRTAPPAPTAETPTTETTH